MSAEVQSNGSHAGSSLAKMPKDLPVPQQDGAAKHLIGHPLPVLVELPTTKIHPEVLARLPPHIQKRETGEEGDGGHDERGYVDLFNVSLHTPVLLFIYPRTAHPTEVIPDSWNQTPGARGCTPHLLSIPPLLDQMRAIEPELQVFALSAQPNDAQQEAADRLRLPFRLLSDAEGELRTKLDLPSFEWEGQRWLKRATLYLREAQVVNLDYPVFPSDTAAQRALEMLKAYHQPSS